MRAERRTVDYNGRQAYGRKRYNHMRRVRQLRRRVLFASTILCVSLIAGIFGCSLFAKAQAEDAVISYKYFTSVQIQPGDTLYSIAQEYADEHYRSVYAYIEEVCLTNHLLEEDINAGDYLVIPYYSTEFR